MGTPTALDHKVCGQILQKRRFFAYFWKKIELTVSIICVFYDAHSSDVISLKHFSKRNLLRALLGEEGVEKVSFSNGSNNLFSDNEI